MRYLAFVLFIFISCSDHKGAQDSLQFVKGEEMHTDSPRKAIKLTPDSLYYCEEMRPYIGEYKYYARKFDKDSFYFFKDKARAMFANIGFIPNDIDDATKYAISLKNNNGRLVLRKEFVYDYLDKDRLDFTLKLEKLFYGKFRLTTNPNINDGLLVEIPPEPLLPPGPSSRDYY